MELASSCGARDAGASTVPVVSIPGIPYYLVPPFLQALQATTLYYNQRFQTKQQHQQQAFTIADWDRLVRSRDDDDNPFDNATKRRKIENDAQGRILDRMAEAAAAHTTSSINNQNDDEGCQKKFMDAVNTWMDRVKHSAQKQKLSSQEGEAIATTTDPGRGQSNENKNTADSEPQKQYNIPYSFFLYLWEVQQQHKRVAVRRAALLLAALLLQKSKDCRAYLDHNTCLKEWVTNLVATENTITMLMRNKKKNLNLERLRKEIVLLHREAIALLDHLRQQYHTFYPKYSVAYKNLQRQCCRSLESMSTIAEGLSSTQNRIVDFRRLRDLALHHGENEITKIETKLQQAHVCLEILIPRMGVEATTTTTTTLSNDTDGGNQPMVQHATIGMDIGSNDDEDDEDDSEIDWEEGERNDNSRTIDDATTTHTAAATSHHQNTQQHLSAVERTIATMQATGTREELAVDFNRGRRKRPRSSNDGGDNLDDIADYNTDDDTVHEDNQEITTTTVRTKQAKAKVQRIIQKLATRHLLRLSAWLDGLRNSDGLVLLPRDTTKDTTSNTTTITKLSSASLVALSAQQQEHRRFLIQTFTGLKDEMTRLMASVASHLHIHAQHVAAAATNPSHTPVHRVLIHKTKQRQKGRRTHRHQHGTTPHKRKIKILLQK